MAGPIELQFEFRNQRWNDASKGLQAFADILDKDMNGSAQVLSREMKAFLDEVAKALVSRHSGGWPSGTGAKTLSKRTGTLTASIPKSVKVEGTTLQNMRGEIGSDVPYAVIQEEGGTIKPKKAKYLCIPLPAALDNRGVPLKSSPREWPNTFVAKSKAGNLLIFQKRGTMIVPLYVLKSSVTIPPRLGMQTTIEAGIPYFVDRACDQIVRSLQQ